MARRANGGTRRSPLDLRRTKRADALIAGAYLSGTNTRRVRRALAALFGGAVGKDTVSRVWRKTKGDWVPGVVEKFLAFHGRPGATVGALEERRAQSMFEIPQASAER